MSSSNARPATASSRSRAGFTLVELLVVVAILLLLMGMLMPMVAMAKRSSLRTISQSVMAKVESALHQYKADFKAYPFQLTEADDSSSWSNALNYNLGTSIAPQDAQNIRDDMAKVEGLYRCWSNGAGSQEAAVEVASPFSFTCYRGTGCKAQDGANDREGDIRPTSSMFNTSNHTWYWVYESTAANWGTWMAYCALLNRLAAERASVNMLVGDINAHGQYIAGATGPAGSGLVYNFRDLTAQALLPNPLSAAKPGWANDYLLGQIEPKYIQGSVILDAYLHPLIYISQVEAGVEPTYGTCYGTSCDVPSPSVYGLAPMGRKTLEPFHPGTTTPLAVDFPHLPDPSDLMKSDIRYYAAPGNELEFELWSAGPDGEMGWMRDDPLNADNIPCEPYNSGIGKMP
jgi:prepilin-type N-terminal cleavage/methylation domain-containing protein